jgi:hypothetical protein
VPTGIVADLYSRKLSVIIGVVLVGAGFMFEGLNPTFAGVLIAQVIWGIGYTFISGAREAWVADEVGEIDAGTAFIKGQQAELAGRFIGIAASIFFGEYQYQLAADYRRRPLCGASNFCGAVYGGKKFCFGFGAQA